jgi:hypothetical protein
MCGSSVVPNEKQVESVSMQAQPRGRRSQFCGNKKTEEAMTLADVVHSDRRHRDPCAHLPCCRLAAVRYAKIMAAALAMDIHLLIEEL